MVFWEGGKFSYDLTARQKEGPLRIVNIVQLSCVALLNLIPFVQFRTREKHPWRNVAFSVTLLRGCFSRSLNWTNDTKSRNASQFQFLGNRVDPYWLFQQCCYLRTYWCSEWNHSVNFVFRDSVILAYLF